MKEATSERLWSFQGGALGEFRIKSSSALIGEGVPFAARLSAFPGPGDPNRGSFLFQGVVSNARYGTGAEQARLVSNQAPLLRPESVAGAMILLRKSQRWWDLPQDERRAIFEERSAHIALGQGALPQVARRLHHCRDLGTAQPFDFITWFDYRPEAEPLFDALLVALRATEEWRYVEREVDLRVVRESEL